MQFVFAMPCLMWPTSEYILPPTNQFCAASACMSIYRSACHSASHSRLDAHSWSATALGAEVSFLILCSFDVWQIVPTEWREACCRRMTPIIVFGHQLLCSPPLVFHGSVTHSLFNSVHVQSSFFLFLYCWKRNISPLFYSFHIFLYTLYSFLHVG